MIGHLTGKLLSEDEQTIILDVNGVGYELFAGNAKEIGKVGETISVWLQTS